MDAGGRPGEVRARGAVGAQLERPGGVDGLGEGGGGAHRIVPSDVGVHGRGHPQGASEHHGLGMGCRAVSHGLLVDGGDTDLEVGGGGEHATVQQHVIGDADTGDGAQLLGDRDGPAAAQIQDPGQRTRVLGGALDQQVHERLVHLHVPGLGATGGGIGCVHVTGEG